MTDKLTRNNRHKNNKKGFATSFVLIMMTVCLLFMGLIYTPILSATTINNSNAGTLNKYITDFTGWLRIYQNLFMNPSLDLSVHYADINKLYKITEIEANTKTVNIGPFYLEEGSFTEIPVTINAATDLKIQVGKCYLELYSLTENAIIYSNSVNTNSEIIIPSDYFYNPNTNLTHYGKYIIKLYSSDQDMTYEIIYNKLLSRKIIINESNSSRILLIDIKDDKYINISQKDG